MLNFTRNSRGFNIMLKEKSIVVSWILIIDLCRSWEINHSVNLISWKLFAVAFSKKRSSKSIYHSKSLWHKLNLDYFSSFCFVKISLWLMTRIYGHFVSNICIVWSTNIYRKLRPTVYLLPFTQLGFDCFNSLFLPWRRALSYQNVIQSCLLSFQQATANKENSIVFFLTLSRNALRIYCHSQIRFMVDRSTILLHLTFPAKIRVRSLKYVFSLLYINIYFFIPLLFW